MHRFSSRLEWNAGRSPLAQAIVAHTGPVLDLTVSNPTTAGFTYSPDLLRTLTNSQSLIYDPNPLGLPKAREAVSKYYNGRVPPSQIVLTSSTSEAYSWVFKLLCDPGDEVLIPRPSYPLFEFLAGLECVRTVQYPMHYAHGWYTDTGALQSLITPRTRAIVVVNPNNPTGSFCKQEEFAFLTTLGLPLIFDEVFADYSFTASPTLCTPHFVLSGLSKVCGLPQLKLGWIAVNDPAYLPGLELIADTFLSVGSPVQHALPALLDTRFEMQRQIRERTRANLGFLRSLRPRLLEPEAGWSAVIQVSPERTEEEWVLHLLTRHSVLVHPGYFYDFESEAFLVLSLLTNQKVFQEGASRIILAATTC
ncbi:MAG: pyridoxal phosphate-dependent aminotransferase [Bryobacteraceae bacterium]|nr:pyridoxal phosphate-dependent aminotransferase [Bryobacteraceae bacterium]